MFSFVMRRLVGAIALMLAVSAISYVLIFSGGQDIARNILGDLATEDQLAALTERLGLNRPIWEQYLSWLGGAVRGDFGVSYFTSVPVVQSIFDRLPVTLSIVIVSILITTALSILLGVTAALRRGWVDGAVQLSAVVAESLPNFWLALVLVAAFAIANPIFPATGYVSLLESPAGWLATIALPVTALAVGGIASGAQQIRSAVIAVLQQDFVRTLRARGLSERSILSRNVLRNAAPPVLTVISLQFIGLMGGSILIERVFALPGIGTLAVNATISGDIPLVVGILMLTTLVVVVVNLLVDIAIGVINPKVRLQ